MLNHELKMTQLKLKTRKHENAGFMFASTGVALPLFPSVLLASLLSMNQVDYYMLRNKSNVERRSLALHSTSLCTTSQNFTINNTQCLHCLKNHWMILSAPVLAPVPVLDQDIQTETEYAYYPRTT